MSSQRIASRRGRPSRDASLDMTDRILAVAGEVFLASGFQAATMDSIAARLGGSKRTLYSRFRSKSELFEEVVRRHGEGAGARLRGIEARSASFPDLLRNAGQVLLARAVHPAAIAMFRLVLAERERFPELAVAIGLEPLRAAVEFLTPHFRRAAASGLLREGDPARLAEQFVLLVWSRDVHRILVGVEEPGVTAERTRRVEDAVRLVLRQDRAGAAPAPGLLIGAGGA